MLPSLTIPLTSAGNTKRRLASTANKRKATATSAGTATKKPRHVTIEEVEDNEGQANNTSDSIPMREAPPQAQSLGKSDSTASVSSAVCFSFLSLIFPAHVFYFISLCRWTGRKTSCIFSTNRLRQTTMVLPWLAISIIGAGTGLARRSS